MVSAALARARKLACAAAEASIVKGIIVLTDDDGWHTVRAMNGRTWTRGDDETCEDFTQRVEHAAGVLAQRTVVILPRNGRDAVDAK